MGREKRKRMMPRHLLTAAILSGTIPNCLLAGDGQLALDEVTRIEAMMTPRRPQPKPRAKSQEEKKPGTAATVQQKKSVQGQQRGRPPVRKI